LTSSLLAIISAATLFVQPGAAKPGEVVLVVVDDASPGVPEGTLGEWPLSFVPCAAGMCALVGLPVEATSGTLPLSVRLSDTVVLEGTVEILPSTFAKKRLTVSKRFTSPSKAEQLRFTQAFDRDFEALTFTEMQWPRPPVITAPFGDLRLINGKKKSQHFGVDLDGDTGDVVQVAAAGEVVMVRDCFASGGTVLVHHGARLFTAYFHLSRIDVVLGQRLVLGHVVGAVGKTGRVTGPHLHWGAKLDGRWVDPVSLLSLDFSGRPTSANVSREKR
jgi:murein DD-endopeptidase MepM/ murein hydrolase activator NlpD